MLEHVPAWLGRLLADRRAGADTLLAAQDGMSGPGFGGAGGLTLTSPAFADGARLPERFTADADAPVSPPLTWTGAPEGCRLALLVEDADAPAAQPLVHAIVWGLEAATGRLAEGAIVGGGALTVGRNSFLQVGWSPPDPPTGHGEHRYAFQLFALRPGGPDPGDAPGRAALAEAMRGRVLAVDVLVGTYSRGEPAASAPEGSTALA